MDYCISKARGVITGTLITTKEQLFKRLRTYGLPDKYAALFMLLYGSELIGRVFVGTAYLNTDEGDTWDEAYGKSVARLKADQKFAAAILRRIHRFTKYLAIANNEADKLESKFAEWEGLEEQFNKSYGQVAEAE